MKVFVVIEHEVIEFVSGINLSVYSTKELAKKEWERRVGNAELDAHECLDEDEREIDKNEERLYFDAYKEGRASEWEVEIYVVEQELDEE